jgi:uncharacterized protein YjiS (DUF1127 family)
MSPLDLNEGPQAELYNTRPSGWVSTIVAAAISHLVEDVNRRLAMRKSEHELVERSDQLLDDIGVSRTLVNYISERQGRTSCTLRTMQED